MAISETKKRIVIDNYFKTECNIDTTIRQAFEKGFKLGLKLAPRERKTGKWVHTNGNTFKCSICGNFLNFHGVNAGRGDANYCPNCGAIMEVDE